MATLSWGKPKIEIGLLGINGAAPTDWIEVDNPVENTSKLNTEAGDKKEAKGEGGELVDTRTGKSKYVFEFELYAKKGKTKPIEDEDGVILENYAVRLTPEDETLEGFILDKSSVSVVDTWDAENGKKWKYTFNALKPNTGKICKPYTANGLAASPAVLYFGNAADSAGKTVAVTSTANPIATSSESWCTVTTAAKVVTVKVAANSTGEARSAFVTITADGKISKVAVTQIPV